MRYYPINVDVRGKRVVVVGAGSVALRKVKGLLQAGADVVVIALKLHPGIRRIKSRRLIDCRQRNFRPGDLKGAVLAFGATGVPRINAQMFEEGRRLRIPVNIVDVPALCSFTVPARISRGELLVTISTGGASPALAKRLRQQLEKFLGPEFAPMTRLLSGLRRMKREGNLTARRVRQIMGLVKKV